MEKKKLEALSDFMREHEIRVTELVEMTNYAKFYSCVPLYEAEEELPIALRYADGEVSKKFKPMRRIKGIHLEEGDIDMEELTIPMSYLNAIQNCRQLRAWLMTEGQALAVYQHFKEINEELCNLGAEPLKKGRYWLETPASKSYLAKAIDFQTGKIQEVKKSESCRVRPMVLI